MGKSRHEEILGEVNPGFNLWTSAHGFHHLSLTNKKGQLILSLEIEIWHYVAMIISFNIFWSYCIIAWQVGWALILLAVTIGLIAILIYYFVFVFSTAVYSRVVIESPDNDGNIIISKVAFIYITLSKELLKCLQFHFYSINCY